MKIEFFAPTDENLTINDDEFDNPETGLPDDRIEPDDDPLPEHCHYRDEAARWPLPT